MLRNFAAAIGVMVCAVVVAMAQEGYPARNVIIVVPLAAGSGTDIMARVLANGLSDKLGRPFIVENRPGANGIPATEYVARQPADGYTLMLGGNTTHSANPHLFTTLKYDPIKDFTPVARLATAGAVLVVAPDAPFKSMADIVGQAKANPGKLTYGAPNSGAQIAGETIKNTTGVIITRVPYRATSEAMDDVMGGIVTMTFVDVAAALANVTSHRLRAIAITSAQRSTLLPDVPTMQEEGFRGFNLTYWNGLFGPALLPKDIVAVLDRASGDIMGQATMKESLQKLGLDASYLPAAEMPNYVATEIDRWGGFVRDAGIEPN